MAYGDGEGVRFAAGALLVSALFVVGAGLWLVFSEGPAPRVAVVADPLTPPPAQPRGEAPGPARLPPFGEPASQRPQAGDAGSVEAVVDAGAVVAVAAQVDAGPSAPAPQGTATLTGEVRDPQHRAVPRVSVRVTRKEGARFTDVATVVSGDDGRFRAEGLPEGVVMLEARAVGYQTRVVDSTTLVAGESRHVELVLESGRRLSGRVVDEAGEPVAGAEVTAVPPAEDDSGDQVQPSAADGRFAFEELGRGPFCLYARKPPFVDGEQCSVPVGAEVVLRLVRGGAIAGRVVRSVGAVPIAKFSIAAMRGGADFELTSVQKSFTSPSGEFRLAELSAGVYTVTVRAENRLFAERAGVEVRPGETTGGLVFELGSTGRITGVVTAVGGKPIEGAKVELLLGGRMGGGQKTLTDAAGRFELERVSAGRHRLNVERTGFHPILLRSLGAAAVGGEPVQLQLRPRP